MLPGPVVVAATAPGDAAAEAAASPTTGALTINDSTFSGNTSSVGSCFHCLALGGGIYNAYNAKTLTISNGTVGGNSANSGLFDAETSLRRVR
jgi:hypothetical protein